MLLLGNLALFRPPSGGLLVLLLLLLLWLSTREMEGGKGC